MHKLGELDLRSRMTFPVGTRAVCPSMVPVYQVAHHAVCIINILNVMQVCSLELAV